MVLFSKFYELTTAQNFHEIMALYQGRPTSIYRFMAEIVGLALETIGEDYAEKLKVRMHTKEIRGVSGYAYLSLIH